LRRSALALASAGAELRFANGWSLAAKFDGEFGGHALTYAGRRRLPSLARNGHADCIARCPLSEAKRKTFARIELFPVLTHKRHSGALNSRL